MLHVLHEEHAFSRFFLNFMLLRGTRTQADLVDQLFNSSGRRLARTLLLMADYGKPGEAITQIPPVTQEILAEMIGTAICSLAIVASSGDWTIRAGCALLHTSAFPESRMHNERCTSGSEGGHQNPTAAMPHGADARPY